MKYGWDGTWEELAASVCLLKWNAANDMFVHLACLSVMLNKRF
jgi:hypothetical protein